MRKRQRILDTYFGEGGLNGKAEKFGSVYVKTAHGPANFFEKTSRARATTEQIIEEGQREYGAVGIYDYPIAKDPYTAEEQADAFLESWHYVENVMGIPVAYGVLDFERYGNVDGEGKYLGKYAKKTRKITELVSKEKKKILLYFSVWTYRELFMWWRNVWGGYQDRFKFIVAYYPASRWREELREIPENNSEPWLLPEIPKKNIIMWQYTDKYPAGELLIGAKEADLNVWLKSEIYFRFYMGKPLVSLGDGRTKRERIAGRIR
jgi:hypothetical protein